MKKREFFEQACLAFAAKPNTAVTDITYLASLLTDDVENRLENGFDDDIDDTGLDGIVMHLIDIDNTIGALTDKLGEINKGINCIGNTIFEASDR